MFKLLFGIVIGMVAANAMRGSARSGARGAGGRVDELSTAAKSALAPTGSFNAGDATPGRSSAPLGSGMSSPSGQVGRQGSGAVEPAIGGSSDTFNAA